MILFTKTENTEISYFCFGKINDFNIAVFKPVIYYSVRSSKAFYTTRSDEYKKWFYINILHNVYETLLLSFLILKAFTMSFFYFFNSHQKVFGFQSFHQELFFKRSIFKVWLKLEWIFDFFFEFFVLMIKPHVSLSA